MRKGMNCENNNQSCIFQYSARVIISIVQIGLSLESQAEFSTTKSLTRQDT